ncbi:DNA replication licensing factor MCM7 [Tanacetum coccineum]
MDARRMVKNIPKYAPVQFYIDNVLPRIKDKKIMALKPFVDRLGALHLRFEKGMVGHSFCDFMGTRVEKALMGLYRLKEWPRRFKDWFTFMANSPTNKEKNKDDVPLSNEEVYCGQNLMAPLRNMFPNLLIPEPTEALQDDDHDILMTLKADEPGTGEVYIWASSKGQPFTIREVRAFNIRQLVKISGIVTSCLDVKPLMKEVTARVFMPLFECPSTRCKINQAKGHLILQLRASKFLKFQAKIQELVEHVPKGHIPRIMTVHFRSELTRKAAPGDVVELSGIFLLIPYTGSRAMTAGLVADTYLEAMSVLHFKKKYEE